MSDEINRLAVFENECNRKDTVIAELRQQLASRVESSMGAYQKTIAEQEEQIKTLESRRESDKLKLANLQEQV